MEIYQQPTKVISYEEFICLREIILSMFSKIYIFENRDYINLFPIRVCIRPDIISALCAHYDEEAQEDVLPESLGDYIDIYSNFLKIGDQYACRYNRDESYLPVSYTHLDGYKRQNFMRVEEVAQELGISKSHAYKVIHKLNAELREKGPVRQPAPAR